LYRDEQTVLGQGFFQEIECAQPYRFHCCLHVTMTGNDNHRFVKALAPHFLEGVHAIHYGHFDVQDGQVRLLGQGQFDTVVTPVGLDGGIPFQGENIRNRFYNILFIVYNQNSFTHGPHSITGNLS